MPRLYERNIQQLRGSSYVITLPKEWVLESGLGKGSSVLLSVEPYIIRITPSTRQVKRSTSLNIDNIGENQLEDAVKWAYSSGLDELIISQPGRVSEKSLNTIRRLRMVIPGMIVSHEVDERIKIEFAELTFQDFTQILKTFLQSVERTLNSAIAYLEKIGEDEVDLPAVIEESIGYSLILTRFAAKSIIHPVLNVSTLRIYDLSTVAVMAAELMDSISELVEYIRRQKSKYAGAIEVIKEIAAIVNKISHLLNDSQNISRESFAIEIVNHLILIREKINILRLEDEMRIMLMNITERIKYLFRSIKSFYLMNVIYPD